MKLNFNRVAGALTVAVLAAATSVTWAADVVKDYPIKPVRMIAPFTPGAGTDTTARLIAKHLGDQWNHQVVVDKGALLQ